MSGRREDKTGLKDHEVSDSRKFVSGPCVTVPWMRITWEGRRLNGAQPDFAQALIVAHQAKAGSKFPDPRT
jgi:hypothetical protein